jgi:hypothetical protein
MSASFVQCILHIVVHGFNDGMEGGLWLLIPLYNCARLDVWMDSCFVLFSL